MTKIALITGASSGIGKATAHRLAKDGYNLIITARRTERILLLQKELEETFGIKVLPLSFDIRQQAEVETHLGNLPEAWQNIDVLVNNAGLAAGLASIEQGDVDDWERMIDTNIKGLLYTTRIVAQGMKQRKSGHIVNISSIAGRETYPNGNVYCATKHAVQSLGEGMRMDLLPYGIKVTQVCPGAVETEFSIVRFHGDKSRADKVYEGFEPLCAEDVADVIGYVVSRPPHVCINDILVMPTAQASGTQFQRE